MHGYKFLILLIPLILAAILAARKPPAEDLSFSPTTVPVQTEPTPAPALEFPCVARGSELIVEKLLSYEGEFWEDGTNDYAVNIAALVVYNPAPFGIRKAELLIRQGQRHWPSTFPISRQTAGSWCRSDAATPTFRGI